MCILFVYTNSQPCKGKYQLILATNRDEYFDRPAASAHRWPEDENVIAGKDMEGGREGGTWFGVSVKRGAGYRLRVGTLLNVTGEHRQKGAAGRGRVVTEYLQGDLPAAEYIRLHLKPQAHTFNAFIFVAVELGDDEPRIIHYNNVTDETVTESSSNGLTIAGFGNSPPIEPLAKVQAGKHRFAEVCEASGNGIELSADLRKLLRWDTHHMPDAVLQRRAPDYAEQLSSVFVNMAEARYGTRTHTLVLVDADGHLEFAEETMTTPPTTEDAVWTSFVHRAHL